MKDKVEVSLDLSTQNDLHNISSKLSELDKDLWEILRHQNTLLEYIALGIWMITLMMLIGITVIAICLTR